MERLSQRGTTLVELMVGILILAIGLVMVITAITSSMRIQSLGANRLIALNIAREGMEAMRNIRDTNWLVNSGNKRQCWNYARGQLTSVGNGKPYVENSAIPDSSAQFTAENKITAARCLLNTAGDPNADINKNPIKAGYYSIVQDLDHTFAWQLENFKTLNADNELGADGVDIREYDYLTDWFTADSDQLSSFKEGDYLNYLLFQIIPKVNTNGEEYPYIYTHASQAMQDGGGYTLRATNPKFFRQIRIRYLCDEPTYDSSISTITEVTPGLSGGYPDYSNNCNTTDIMAHSYTNSVSRNDNRIEVTAIVQWFEGGRVHEVRLMTHLTDWLERKGHDA